jgi:hypothetical protein
MSSTISGASTAPQSTATRDQRTREAREAFTTSLSTIGSSIDADLQSRAKNIHSNSAALKKQEDQLTKSTKELGKENKRMEGLVEKTKRDLGKVMDRGGGMEGMEAKLDQIDDDLAVLEEMMRIVEEGDWDSEGDVGGEEGGLEGVEHEHVEHGESLSQDVNDHGKEPWREGVSGKPGETEHLPSK